MIQNVSTSPEKTLWTHEKLYKKIKDCFRDRLWKEEYAKVKYRINDQLLKAHVAYCEVKAWLKKKNWSNYKHADFIKLVDEQIENVVPLIKNWVSISFIIDSFIASLIHESGLTFSQKSLIEIYSQDIADRVESNLTSEWGQKNHKKMNWWEISSLSDLEKWMKNFVKDVMMILNQNWISSILESWNNTENDLIIDLLKLSFTLSEWKHHWQYRTTNEKYFEHIIRTARNNLEIWEKYTVLQSIIDLLHDVPEDSNISFDTLLERFGAKIALSVIVITKKSALTFVWESDWEDYMKISEILDSWICNAHLEIRDHVKSIIRKVESKKTKEKQEKVTIKSQWDVEKYASDLKEFFLTDIHVHAIGLHFSLTKNKEYKERRNTEYNKRFDDLKAYVIELISIYEIIGLSDEDINDICVLAATTKSADRRDNLENPKTLPNGSIDPEAFEKNIESTLEIIRGIIDILWESHPNVTALQRLTSHNSQKFIPST
jgi:hypothetical protein